MRRTFWSALLFLCAWALLPAHAQLSSDPANAGKRLLLVVPIIGQGTAADPRRPLFAPRMEEMAKLGIESFSWERGDDGRTAILEIVARDRSVFDAMIADRRVVKAFEKGRARKEDIELELRKVKRDFNLIPVKGPRVIETLPVAGTVIP